MFWSKKKSQKNIYKTFPWISCFHSVVHILNFLWRKWKQYFSLCPAAILCSILTLDLFSRWLVASFYIFCYFVPRWLVFSIYLDFYIYMFVHTSTELRLCVYRVNICVVTNKKKTNTHFYRLALLHLLLLPFMHHIIKYLFCTMTFWQKLTATSFATLISSLLFFFCYHTQNENNKKPNINYMTFMFFYAFNHFSHSRLQYNHR